LIHAVSSRQTPLLCLVASLVLSLTVVAAAQEPEQTPSERRTLTAERLQAGESIKLDGHLDEPFWRRAEVGGDFKQIDPDNGQPATERTEIRIAFNADSFYLGVIAYDSEIDWVRFQKRRDEPLQSDDKVQWTIDTFLDGRTGYFFETNASGAMADALIGTTGQNRQWDGIWNERVSRNEDGWSFEVEIPFRTLNFNPDGDTWGLNISRSISRKNENTIWMGWARNQGLNRMTNAGRVTGLSQVSQGHGLDIKPYLLGSAQDVLGKDAEGTGQAGVDIFYNITPALRANLTINTDFAQTEVDQRQVNLTRFSLLYPEKRDFFLDGTTFFDFASPGAGSGGGRGGGFDRNDGSDLIVNPFFSRRIGLNEAQGDQQILYGTKATGQIERQDIGVLQVRTGQDGAVPGEDFTVARVKRRMLRQSYVGATYTRRDAHAPGLEARHTTGLDFRLATSSFRQNQNLSLSGWFLRAPARGTSGGNAYGAALGFPNDKWNANFDVRSVDDTFDPAVGFITRRAYRRYLPTMTYGPRPRNISVVRQYNFRVTADIQTTLDNTKIARNFNIQPFQAELAPGDQFGVQVMPRSERLDSPFVINISPTEKVVLPVGSEYDFLRYQLNWRTSNRRMVAFDGRYEDGDFYSGTRREFVANVTFRLAPGIFIYTSTELNRIAMPEAPDGEFTTRLYRLVPELQFTPFLTWVNNVQYDTVSGVAGWQSRFRWIMKPGNDLYIVYTQNWLDDPLQAQFVSQDRRLSTKALYTYRF